MTKTQWIDAFQNIKKQIVSFLSVIVIAMLAVLIYLAINFAAAAMDRNVSAYYNDRNIQDVQVVSPLLLTEDDLQAICALDGIADAEGSNQTTAWLRTEEQNFELTVLTLAERIAVPEILEGCAPQSAQECLLEQKLAEKTGVQIGAHVQLTGASPDSAPLLMAETEFTVTGLFSHPDHITDNVRYSYYVIVTEDAFDQSTLEGNWVRVRVAMSDVPANRFSKDYWKAVSSTEELLKALSVARSPQRLDEVRETYEKRISDGEAQLEDAKTKLEDADAQLQDAEAQILDAEAQISDGEEQIAEGEQKLKDGETQIRENEQRILDGEQQLRDAEKQIREGEEQIADGEKKLREGEEKLAEGERELQENEQLIRDGEQQLHDAEQQLRDGEKKIADGEQELRENEARIADGEKQIADGEQKLRDAEAQVRDGEAQIADGEAQLLEAEATAAGALEELEKGRADLAEAERLLGLAPGLLAAGEAKLRSAPDQLEAGKEKLDTGLEKLQEAQRNIDEVYGLILEYGPTEAQVQKAKEIAAEFDVDLSGIPDDITSWAADKAVDWIKENTGFNSEMRRYLNGLQEYRDALEAYEKGQNDYYYMGEQYLDGLTAFEKGKKAIEEAEAKFQQLDDARELLEQKKQELAEGKKELEAGREELEAKKDELEAGKKKLEAGREELEAGRKELETGREEYEAKKQELEEGKEKLEAGREELEAGREELEAGRKELASKKEELEAGKEEFEAKKEELETGKKELEAGREELEAGRKELEEKRAELRDAKQRIEDARAELAEKKQEYEDGLRSYEDFRARLDAAREELEQLETGAWIVMNNRADIGYVFCEENSRNLTSLSSTFALMFVIIAALVIYASVGRMVDEQSVLVGTTKALGFYNREVLLKYMVFGVLGTVAGALLGILLAWCVLQPMILHMYAPYYNITEAPKCFLPFLSLIMALGGLAISVIAVWLASSRLLKRSAMQLMKGEDPVRQRKSKKSKKSSSTSLYTQLILLNMISDLKRVIVTTVSIAGCCMLLLIGFMLKNGQDHIAERQFDRIQTFDAELRFDPAVETAEQTFSAILDDLGADYITVHREDVLFSCNDHLSATRLVAAEPGSLTGYYNLKDANTGEDLLLAEQGVLVPLRISEDYTIRPGTPLTIYDGTGQRHESVAAGIFNCYCERYFFLSYDAWRELFAEQALPNCFYVKLNGIEISELTGAVSDTEGYLTVTDATSKRIQLEQTSKALNVLIIVMIVMAGLMAFFILVNLSGSYMIHKQKELTIMRINGFTVKECTRYAATELILTTIIGILLGLLLGAPLGYLIQKMMESSDVQLVRGADIWSIVLASLITMLFSAVINSIALRKVKTLKLSDI